MTGGLVPAGQARVRDPEQSAAERRTPAFSSRQVVALAVGVGVTLRVLQYAANRSLWLDEALVAPVIADRSFRELLHPGAWGALPPGYLWLSKLAVTLLGNNEYALRLIPLLAGVASVFLFLAVGRRYLTSGAVPLALWLFALSPFLIYYASEVKQYSTDVAVTLLLLLTVDRLRQRGLDGRGALIWWLAGTLAVVVSQAAVFIVGGATLTLIALSLRQREWGAVRGLALACAGWGVLFGVPYFLFVAQVGNSEYAQAFWRSGFMPMPPRSLADLAWFPDTFARVFRDPLGILDDRQTERGFYQAAAGMLAFIAGCVWMKNRRGDVFWLLIAPVLLTVLASALQRYPFGGDWASGGRVILFLVPIFLLLMAEGAEQLRRALRGSMRALAMAVIALLIIPPAAQALIAIPYGRAEIKPLLGYLRQHWQPGDRLYVHYDARHSFSYYAPRYGIAPSEYILGPCARFKPEAYLQALNAQRGAPRIWILFGGGVGAAGFNEQAFMLDFLDHFGTRLDDRVARGSALFLYDPRAPAPNAGSYLPRIPRIVASIEEGCALWGGEREDLYDSPRQ